MQIDRETHWQTVYSTKAEDAVSWYEERPSFSLDLINGHLREDESSIVDVGGGASHLVDALVAAARYHVTVVDISAKALEIAKARLIECRNVEFFVSDITKWQPDRKYDLWHDRAAFHFLVEPSDQAVYVDVMVRALKPGAIAIIGTFSMSGPQKCSGLDIVRYDPAKLSDVLRSRFELLSSVDHRHTTPWGSPQDFQFSTFKMMAS